MCVIRAVAPSRATAVRVVPEAGGAGSAALTPGAISETASSRPPAAKAARAAAATSSRSPKPSATADQPGCGDEGVLLLGAAALPVAGAELCVERLRGCRHAVCLVPQLVDEGGDDAPTCRGVGLDLAPVRLDLPRRRSGHEVEDLRDPRQRHPQQSQRRHESGALQLTGGVAAVARVRVDLRRRQQPQVVVQPQRLRRQPGDAGEVADGHQRRRSRSSSPSSPVDLTGTTTVGLAAGSRSTPASPRRLESVPHGRGSAERLSARAARRSPAVHLESACRATRMTRVGATSARPDHPGDRTCPSARARPPAAPRSPWPGRTHGNRSAVTCHLRCGDACFVAAPNTTETSYFRDVAATALSRRSVVGAGLTVAAVAALPAAPVAAAPGAARRAGGRSPGRPALHRHRTGGRHRRHRVRAGRLPVGRDPALGRPDPRRRAGLRPAPPERRRAGGPVRLQQRLPRHHRDQPLRHQRPARVQPRVHQRGHHVPARHPARDRHPHRVGGARDVRGRADPAQARRRLDVRPGCAPQPADHPRHPVRRRRPRRRLRPAEDRRPTPPAARCAAP